MAYSLAPLPGQLIMVCAVSVLAYLLRQTPVLLRLMRLRNPIFWVMAIAGTRVRPTDQAMGGE